MIPAILTAIVGLVVVALIAWPLIDRRAVDALPADNPELRDLNERVDQALRAVREIDFDHRAGNLSDEDFRDLDRAARAEAARLLRRRDAMENDVAGTSRRGDAG